MATSKETNGMKQFEDIRQEGLRRFNYKESKLVAKCPYDALLEDFYEKGCSVAASILEHCIQKEEYEMEHGPIKRLCDDRTMLLHIFGRACHSEMSWRCAKNDEARRTAIKAMYDLLVYIDGQDKDYRWLYYDCCTYFVKFFKTFQVEASDEILAKVLYRYGLMKIESEGEPDKLACDAFAEALYFCEAKLWGSDVAEDNKYFNDLHTGVALKMAEANIAYGAKLKAPEEREEGLRLHEEAVKAVRKLNLFRSKIKKMYYTAYMAKARYHLLIGEAEKGAWLMSVFRAIFEEDKNTKIFQLIHAQAHELEGICYMKMRRFRTAHGPLIAALRISEKYGYPKISASVSFNLALVYHNTMDIPRANLSSKKARDIYEALHDKSGVKKAEILMAKIQANTVFCEYLNLMKSKNYSDVSTLLDWQLKAKPFWNVNAKLELKEYLNSVCPDRKDQEENDDPEKLITKIYDATLEDNVVDDGHDDLIPPNYPKRYHKTDSEISLSSNSENI